MKKLLAIALAIAMVASFALVASADETPSYTASLVYCDGDMNDMALAGTITTEVTGSGTYTLTYDASASADGAWGALMLYVDIADAYSDMSDWVLSDVKVSVDGTELEVNQEVAYVDPTADLGAATTPKNAVYVYHSGVPGEENHYIIELANFYAGFTLYHEAALDTGGVAGAETWRATESITVTFTLTDPDDVAEEPEDETTEEPEDETTEEPEDETTEEPKDETTEEPKDETTEEPKDESKDEEKEDAPVADDSNAKTGDALSVVFALMAVSAAGIAVISKKKLF